MRPYARQLKTSTNGVASQRAGTLWYVEIMSEGETSLVHVEGDPRSQMLTTTFCVGNGV
jgi:hypothetical protein